jgi:class 3 adenylate cyclase
MTLQKEKSEKSTNPHDSPSLEFQKELAKKVAILFTDVKGSSAFYKTHGNLAGRIMIQKLNDMLFPIVTAYKGLLSKRDFKLIEDFETLLS